MVNQVRRSGRRGDQRGMVTAELAVTILAAVLVLVIMCWGVVMLILQLRLVDTAGAAARQAARGDRAAVTRVQAQAPQGAVVRVRVTERRTYAEIRLQARPFGRLTPAVSLRARAEAATEPGVK